MKTSFPQIRWAGLWRTPEGARDYADAMLVDGETVPVFAEPDGQC